MPNRAERRRGNRVRRNLYKRLTNFFKQDLKTIVAEILGFVFISLISIAFGFGVNDLFCSVFTCGPELTQKDIELFFEILNNKNIK